MNQIRGSKQLQIGALIFPGVDQIDFTGPFEIFSRLPGATYHIIAKDKKPIRDTRGLILTPEKTYSEISRLDLLHVPGGPGQEALMDDEETLSFIREQAANADYIFSVCTGALILGAAGLLVGKSVFMQLLISLPLRCLPTPTLGYQSCLGYSQFHATPAYVPC